MEHCMRLEMAGVAGTPGKRKEAACTSRHVYLFTAVCPAYPAARITLQQLSTVHPSMQSFNDILKVMKTPAP